MRIFVYGTLKRGLSNHGWMAGQQFIREARTTPAYRMVDSGGYPGMFAVEHGGVSIQGEIWEVDEPGRKKLDVLEDVEGGEYALELVRLADADPRSGGAEEPIYTYLYKWSVVGMRDAGTDWRI
jgi:gamma-glutamylaminecyclotransferase